MILVIDPIEDTVRKSPNVPAPLVRPASAANRSLGCCAQLACERYRARLSDAELDGRSARHVRDLGRL
jgi:hypothetical protein